MQQLLQGVARHILLLAMVVQTREVRLIRCLGIALRRGYGTRVTTAGLAVGSTAYMPPVCALACASVCSWWFIA